MNYETQEPAQVEIIGDDKRTLIYNEFITIKNIAPHSFNYVVNGRSPLEWIIDCYQVKTDSASGIVNTPND